MDERRHNVAIGAFVVGAVFVAIAAALFFGGAGIGREHSRVVMAFDGSVKGLTVGAPVAMRGVQIGQVTDIQAVLDLDAADITMVVEADLQTDAVQLRGDPIGGDARNRNLIERGLRAQLNLQSVLTGLLYVQLDFHPDTPAAIAEIDSPLPQIPTIPTELEQLRKTLQSVDYAAMAESAQKIAEGIRNLLEDEDLRAIPGEMRNALAALQGAGARIDGSLQSLEPDLARALGAVGDAAEGVNAALPQLAGDLREALGRLNAALGETRDAMAGLGTQVGAGSPTLQQLQTALRDVSRASRALHGFLMTLDDQPDALLRGRRAEAPQ